MKIIKDLAVKIVAGLIVGIVLTGMFHPDIFSKGIQSVDWIFFIKILIGIGIFAAWMYITVYYKTKGITDDNKKLIKDVQDLRNIVSARSRDHFYTTDEDERIKAIQRYGYTDEKIACYVFSVEHGKHIEGAVPLYRLFSRR